MNIKIDDLTDSKIQLLLREHLEDMAQISPPDSCYALGLEELRKPEITFWSLWSNDELLGCGALKELNSQHGEIKSMRIASVHRRKGLATVLLNHILEEAKRRNYKRVSLEGSVTSSVRFRWTGPKSPCYFSVVGENRLDGSIRGFQAGDTP